MLDTTEIEKRLAEMANTEAPGNSLWPENCEGSQKAMVIFVGPSPGGKKNEGRRALKLNVHAPYWNQPYNEPLGWSRGFKKSFLPIVEALFGSTFTYSEAAKLIARINMDWQGNPESRDVSFRYMWEGCSNVLPVIYECSPSILVPMDEKTFGVLQIALFNDGWEIATPSIKHIRVLISNKKKARYHKSIMAFIARKDDNEMIIIKSLQHPARIYDAAYATRIGETIREATTSISENNPVSIEKT